MPSSVEHSHLRVRRIYQALSDVAIQSILDQYQKLRELCVLRLYSFEHLMTILET